ncbi:MAG: DUF4330 domain-containing protein [Nanoarchaeota archaeon]|nr:DUF4330 domain-containing protein [Nanoarchaeota archaeon]MBU1005763.1 DUF4330 domain-containing protein [Nanoarchaeota archaeon]MBU1946634.1 DUF4330 domain-containing protein [Nanoarchaeota archaeon]
MGIIDQKGRLFGRINVIDFTILVVVLLVVLAGVIYFLRGESWVEVKLIVCDENPAIKLSGVINCGHTNILFLDSVQPGDVETERGKVIARINDIILMPSIDKPLDQKYNSIILGVAILAKKNWDNDLIYKNAIVKANSILKLKTDKSIIHGRIFSLGALGSNDSSRKDSLLVREEVELQLLNQEEWVANAIKVNSTEVDLNGRVVARIISKEVWPAEIQIVSDSGEVFRRISPIYKDITLRAELLVEKAGENDYYYNKAPVKVGESLRIATNNILISGTITRV